MFKFPQYILVRDFTIAALEMWNVLVALRLLVNVLRGHVIELRCDNAVSVSILQTGRGRCPVLLELAREIWAITAREDMFLHVSHIKGVDNYRADKLSQAHKSDSALGEVMDEVKQHDAILHDVTEDIFKCDL